MDEYTMHQRLLMQLRDQRCGGNSALLARMIKKDPTYVNRLFYPAGKKGGKGIGLEIMTACNEAFFLWPGFWDGAQETDSTADAVSFTRLDDSPAPSMQPILAWNHEDDLPPGEFVMIPRMAVHLSAGNGHEQTEIEFVKKQPQAFRADWIRQKHLKPAKLAAMSASGNSMEPRIWDGDSLVVDTSQIRVVDGKVYALWYDGGERVKRLFGMPGGGLRISSDNPAFETIEVSADELEHVRILGRVVHIAGDGGL